jgi:hypothetical protein
LEKFSASTTFLNSHLLSQIFCIALLWKLKKIPKLFAARRGQF